MKLLKEKDRELNTIYVYVHMHYIYIYTHIYIHIYIYIYTLLVSESGIYNIALAKMIFLSHKILNILENIFNSTSTC